MKLDEYIKLSELLTKLRYEVLKSISDVDDDETREKTDEVLDAICTVQEIMIIGE